MSIHKVRCWLCGHMVTAQASRWNDEKFAWQCKDAGRCRKRRK